MSVRSCFEGQDLYWGIQSLKAEGLMRTGICCESASSECASSTGELQDQDRPHSRGKPPRTHRNHRGWEETFLAILTEPVRGSTDSPKSVDLIVKLACSPYPCSCSWISSEKKNSSRIAGLGNIHICYVLGIIKFHSKGVVPIHNPVNYAWRFRSPDTHLSRIHCLI